MVVLLVLVLVVLGAEVVLEEEEVTLTADGAEVVICDVVEGAVAEGEGEEEEEEGEDEEEEEEEDAGRVLVASVLGPVPPLAQ